VRCSLDRQAARASILLMRALMPRGNCADDGGAHQGVTFLGGELALAGYRLEDERLCRREGLFSLAYRCFLALAGLPRLEPSPGGASNVSVQSMAFPETNTRPIPICFGHAKDV
jgi:hypothetical protein